MYRGRCIPGSILPSNRYAAKGFSSSHCKPGSTVKEDKEVHSGIFRPKQNSVLTLEKDRPLKQRARPFDKVQKETNYCNVLYHELLLKMFHVVSRNKLVGD